MMKKEIFIVLVSLCSCTKITNCINSQSEAGSMSVTDSTMAVDKIDYVTIDTIGFVSYWNQFQQAILKQDTTILTSMINDSIIGGWFLFKDINNLDKLPKSLFLKNLYVLFTPEFLSLLNSYEIEKYLNSNRENIIWKIKEKKIYRSRITFNYTQLEPNGDYHRIAEYQMSCFRDKREPEAYVMLSSEDIENSYLFIEQIFGRMDYIGFHFVFVKNVTGIKLYSVDFSYNYCISD